MPKGNIEGDRVKHTAIEGNYALCKGRRWREWSVRGVTRDSAWRKEKYERERSGRELRLSLDVPFLDNLPRIYPPIIWMALSCLQRQDLLH